MVQEWRARPVEANFRIRSASFNEALHYRGINDEAFVFERALSQEEVQQIMNEGFWEAAQDVDSKGKTATVWGRIKSTR